MSDRCIGEPDTAGGIRVRDIMTPEPFVATPDTPLNEIAFRMIQYNCGAIPIVDDLERRRLLGIVTDRDIIARAVSLDRNPLALRAEDVMTLNPKTIDPDAPIAELYELFRREKVRRVVVVDRQNRVVGIVSLSDLALRLPLAEQPEAEHVIRDVVCAP